MTCNADSGLRIQLWSYNYAPEPTGIGPVSAVWAREMRALGHRVEVVAAHPHYPEPRWGSRRMPYRQRLDGIPVLRLPIWAARGSTSKRIRQELVYAATQAAAIPFLSTPDVVVVVSPSFPALLPAMVNASLRKVPWVLWLQDILPDGASSTGMVKSGPTLASARRLETAAYRSASRVVVISETFEENLLSKGVPMWKLRRIYNPATRVPGPLTDKADAPYIVTTGNIGASQGLAPLVREFQESDELRARGARWIITGTGVGVEELRALVDPRRVTLTGVLSDREFDAVLAGATLGVVTQRPDIAEFNLPSKLMNFMAWGLPTVAAVRPDSEVARLVSRSRGGWVADSASPESVVETISRVLTESDELEARGARARKFARAFFTPAATAEWFSDLISEILAPDQVEAGDAR